MAYTTQETIDELGAVRVLLDKAETKLSQLQSFTPLANAQQRAFHATIRELRRDLKQVMLADSRRHRMNREAGWE